MHDMFPMFSSAFFAGNRARLRQLFTGKAPIVITAQGLLQRNSDNVFAFRQDSSFWYLTGIDEPDVVLVLDKEKEYLIVRDRDEIREFFDGKVLGDVLSRRSGIATVYDEKTGWKQLGGRLKRSKHVATLAPSAAYAEWHGLFTNPARAELVRTIKTYNEAIEVLDLREHLAKMRVVKQPQEIAAIQLAVDTTIDGLTYVTNRRRLKQYAYEYEVEADLLHQFRRTGHGVQAFDPIVASGARACQLHYMDNNGPLAADELLVFDVGVEVSNYAADIARTVPLGDNGPSRRQQAVFDAVCEVQDYALSLIKPGVVNIDYEKLVETFMGEKLRELGLIKTIDKANVRRFFPHLTSHFLGLDAHDVGDYKQPLVPGVVMVCEPGIYIPEEGIGVRIEDDLVITDDGYRLLSSRLPRQLW
jgi:Xaa-Pro aminopeptidase